MRLRPAGTKALLVELDDLRDVRAYYAEARRREAHGELPSTREIVPAAQSVLFDGVADCAALAAAISSWRPSTAADGPSRTVEVPVVYDGPDLAFVAAVWGVPADEVSTVHAALAHQVAFLGFSPGFAYVAGLDDDRRVPRLERPRTSVPAGSVAVADRFTGIYPRPSPGGWRIIGRTDVTMWDPQREPASYLNPGDLVRFVRS